MNHISSQDFLLYLAYSNLMKDEDSRMWYNLKIMNRLYNKTLNKTYLKLNLLHCNKLNC